MTESQSLSAHRLNPIALALLASLLGCDSRPKAPVLRDAPVYQNDAEGFRFLVPKGWIQTASAVLPPERLEGEVVLVRYRMRTSEKTALVELRCFDRENVDLEQYQAEPISWCRQLADRQPAHPARDQRHAGRALSVSRHDREGSHLQGGLRLSAWHSRLLLHCSLLGIGPERSRRSATSDGEYRLAKSATPRVTSAVMKLAAAARLGRNPRQRLASGRVLGQSTATPIRMIKSVPPGKKFTVSSAD